MRNKFVQSAISLLLIVGLCETNAGLNQISNRTKDEKILGETRKVDNTELDNRNYSLLFGNKTDENKDELGDFEGNDLTDSKELQSPGSGEYYYYESIEPELADNGVDKEEHLRSVDKVHMSTQFTIVFYHIQTFLQSFDRCDDTFYREKFFVCVFNTVVTTFGCIIV